MRRQTEGNHTFARRTKPKHDSVTERSVSTGANGSSRVIVGGDVSPQKLRSFQTVVMTASVLVILLATHLDLSKSNNLRARRQIGLRFGHPDAGGA